MLTFEVTQDQALQIINANQGGSQIYLVLLRARPAGADCRSGQGRGEQQVAHVESYATVESPIETAATFDVAVVEPDANLRTRLAVELAGAAQFETMEDLVQQLNPTRPVVAVFGPGFASPIGFQHVHRVTSTHRELGVVFAVYELSTDVLQQALRAGARDAVVIGGEASLHQSVDRVGELLAGADHSRHRLRPRVPGRPGA